MSEIGDEMSTNGSIAKSFISVMPGRAWGVVIPLAALTALGLVFLWLCPDPTHMHGPHWPLKSQLARVGIGVSGCLLAVLIGWRRLVMATPWLVAIALLGVVAVHVFGNGRARESGDVLPRLWAQEECRAAMNAAHWFSPNEAALQKTLPGRFSQAMPAAAAMAFGKWFNVVAMLGFAAFAGALVLLWRTTEGAGKKAFVAVAGNAILLQALHAYGARLEWWPPIVEDGVPLVSFGGGVVMPWVIAGTFVALVREGRGGEAG